MAVTTTEATKPDEALDALAATLRTEPPTATTAAHLASLDPAHLSPRGRIDALAALERHMSWLHSRQTALLSAIKADAREATPPELLTDDEDWAAEEVACALKLATSTAADRLDTAVLLHDRHPKTLALLGAGDISYQQARAMADLCAVLDDEKALQVESAMTAKLPTQTAGQTRSALRHAILKADPEGAQARHERRKRERETVRYPQEDGMALFGAILPAHQAARMERAVDARAATYTAADDTRTLPQKRADALYDLVVNNRPGKAVSPHTSSTEGPGPAPTALIQVTVPLNVLIGADDSPADLKGYGPITASQAREVAFAPGTIWRRLITHPDTGLLIKTDPTTYRPTAETARQVRARDQECTFPTCRMPAHRCDLDHIEPFNHQHPHHGGRTTPDNLHPLCRRHHRLKTHHPGWRAARDPRTGTTEWRSPTGRGYSNLPSVYRD